MNIINKIRDFILPFTTKEEWNKLVAWFKTYSDIKIMGASFIVGILTFSAWATLFICGLIVGGFYYLKTKIPETYRNMISLNVTNYVINIAIGLLLGSFVNWLI